MHPAMEYSEPLTNLNMMVKSLEQIEHEKAFKEWLSEMRGSNRKKGRRKLDPTFLEVRPSICVAGHTSSTIQWVKRRLADLCEEPMALESFHVKDQSDVNDGALLVPKVVLVAPHCPGKKLIDEEGEEGILDVLYDKVCEVGADLLVVYVDLPRSIYPPVRHMIHHPRMEEMLFSTQKVLRRLAEEHSLITVVENSELTHLQKNVIREWLSVPVTKEHQVYKTADYLSSVEYGFSDVDCWSETEIYNYQASANRDQFEQRKYISATEEHPLADVAERRRRKKKKSSRIKLSWNRKGKKSPEIDHDLLAFNEEDQMELDIYRETGVERESFDTLSV